MDKPRLTDRSTVHLIIKSATLVALCCLAAGVALAVHGDKDAALVLLPTTTGAVGGLLAMLARTGTNDHTNGEAETPTPVTVTNTTADPVPTAPVEGKDSDGRDDGKQ